MKNTKSKKIVAFVMIVGLTLQASDMHANWSTSFNNMLQAASARISNASRSEKVVAGLVASIIIGNIINVSYKKVCSIMQTRKQAAEEADDRLFFQYLNTANIELSFAYFNKVQHVKDLLTKKAKLDQLTQNEITSVDTTKDLDTKITTAKTELDTIKQQIISKAKTQTWSERCLSSFTAAYCLFTRQTVKEETSTAIPVKINWSAN